MDVMGIASAASDMKAARLQTEVSMRVLKMAMDTTEIAAEELISLMAVADGIGQSIDVMA